MQKSASPFSNTISSDYFATEEELRKLILSRQARQIIAPVQEQPPEKEKSSPESEALQKAFNVIRASRPLTLGKFNRELPIRINFPAVFSTTAGAVYTTPFSIIPGVFNEYATLAALYDEVIVDGGVYEWTSTVTTNFTSNSGINRAVICFDPLLNTALATFSQGLQHMQHLQYQACNSGNPITLPICMNKDGIMRFRWRTPRKNARTTSATTIFGHEWSSTADVNQIYGFLKWHIPVSGATGVITHDGTVTLDCRFRCRS
jgi:hypothetical protein